MDLKLLAWGLRGKPGPLPRLWLFTDQHRLADPRPSVAALPRGRAGVVLRHDGDPCRATLGRDLARICRQRNLTLVVAGDARLAASLKAGLHLRGGFRPSVLRPPGIITSSAHSVRDLTRAHRTGAALVFLSPAFPTESHRGAPGLGPLRWAALARQAACRPRIGALGGVDGQTIARLPLGLCQAVGAIGALSAGS
ncbi:MAG TPA: thiamine phosphate synthase [Acetobacteraceae bacterium]|jgi:thiamine-phosphate pyrophosphorylase|nr:thiamine phosphate synthase [Acetobacteraceae bacterium]